MLQSKFYRFFLCLLVSNYGWASKAITVNHGSWNDSYAWLGYQVPVNPDTIVIKHYITFSQNLTISAPTVLIIEQEGTLCGDYLLDISCGASFINYGHLYVNSAKIRDGKNYFEFHCKNQVTILGCNLPGYGNGYYNIGPNGTTLVWPPVICKSPGTNWEGGSPNAIRDYFKDIRLSISPTLISEDDLVISCDLKIAVSLTDVSGKLLFKSSGETCYQPDLGGYSPGIYFLQVSAGGRQLSQKIVKQ